MSKAESMLESDALLTRLEVQILSVVYFGDTSSNLITFRF